VTTPGACGVITPRSSAFDTEATAAGVASQVACWVTSTRDPSLYRPNAVAAPATPSGSSRAAGSISIATSVAA